MTDKTMQRLASDVTRAWDAYTVAVVALRTYANARKVEMTKTAKVIPSKLVLVDALVSDIMRAEPGRQWNTWTLAVEIVNSCGTGMSAKSLQNVYLPALRATSPHCVRSGRQYLWFQNAGFDATGSRDTGENGAKV